MRAADNRIEDRSAAPGARRAAILLLALGAEATASIFEHLEADDVKVLSLAMARLGVVTNDDIDSTLNNFGEAFSSHRALVATSRGRRSSCTRCCRAVRPSSWSRNCAARPTATSG